MIICRVSSGIACRTSTAAEKERMCSVFRSALSRSGPMMTAQRMCSPGCSNSSAVNSWSLIGLLVAAVIALALLDPKPVDVLEHDGRYVRQRSQNERALGQSDAIAQRDPVGLDVHPVRIAVAVDVGYHRLTLILRTGILPTSTRRSIQACASANCLRSPHRACSAVRRSGSAA